MTAAPSFHLVGCRQADRALVLVFLDVIPNKLLSQPRGLPAGKLSILERQTVPDDKPGAALITRYSRHFNKIGCAATVVPHPLSHPLGPLLLRFPQPYHRGSRG